MTRYSTDVGEAAAPFFLAEVSVSVVIAGHDELRKAGALRCHISQLIRLTTQTTVGVGVELLKLPTDRRLADAFV